MGCTPEYRIGYESLCCWGASIGFEAGDLPMIYGIAWGWGHVRGNSQDMVQGWMVYLLKNVEFMGYEWGLNTCHDCSGSCQAINHIQKLDYIP